MLQTQCCVAPESPKKRVEPSTLRVTAIIASPLERSLHQCSYEFNVVTVVMTTPRCYSLSQAQDDLQQGIPATNTRCAPFVAATMLCSLSQPKERVEQTILRVTAIIEFSRSAKPTKAPHGDGIGHEPCSLFNPCFSVLQTTVNLQLCKIDHWLSANKFFLNYSMTSRY